MYSVGLEHPYRERCQRIIEAVRAGSLRATTTVEALQEFTHVRARRRSRADAATLASSFALLLRPLLTITADDLAHGLTLFERHERVGAFDAVLAATAMRSRAKALVSTDSGFSAIKALNHVDPAGSDFDDLFRDTTAR